MKLLFVVFLVSLACAGPSARASEPCAEPGAVREDSEGGVSICVAGDGWRRVVAHGLQAAAPRAAPDCTGQVGQWVCDSTCSALGVCLSDDLWMSAGNCPSGQICLEGECVVSSEACPTLPKIKCLNSGTYPSLTDCTKYYTCSVSNDEDPGEAFIEEQCADGLVFDACTGECNIALPTGRKCPWVLSDPCTAPGIMGVAPNSDRLYYVCVRDSTGMYQVWVKCLTGHFDQTTKVCGNAAEPGCGSC